MAIGKLHTNPGDSWASKSTAMDIHNTREIKSHNQEYSIKRESVFSRISTEKKRVKHSSQVTRIIKFTT